MDELIAFLSARLDKDEAIAQAAARKRRGAWRVLGDHLRAIVHGSRGPDLAVADTPGTMIADHVALHDPSRVLWGVTVKRSILAACANTREYEDCGGMLAREIMRWLGAEFRDHPDYRPEWKP